MTNSAPNPSPQHLGDNLIPYDGELYLIRQFYHPHQADLILTALLAELAWQQEDLFIFGRWHKVPRLMCWYGDPSAHYRYSGVNHTPQAWHPRLQPIRQNLEQHCGCTFNSVLGNLYRDGKDSMGCHADNEPELGPTPLIASLSLGAERIFKLHHNRHPDRLSIPLGHGDLLIMAGTLQQHWQHAIPKTQKTKTARINLTFRSILAANKRSLPRNASGYRLKSTSSSTPL